MKRPGFYCCICPDAGLIKEHIATLLVQYPPEGAPRWEQYVFWGDEELPPRFWEHLTLQGLFATPKVVIVRQAHTIPAVVWKRLSAVLATPQALCLPIVCLEVAWEKGQPKIPAHIGKLRCISFADQQGWIWRAPGLDERTIKKYVQAQAKTMGLHFAPGGLEAVCASTSPQATAIHNELNKLALAAHEGGITPAMVSGGGYVPESNIFALIRHIQSGNIRSIWQESTRGQKEGDGLIFPLLALLLREVRQLWQILHEDSVRMYPQDLAAKRTLATTLGYTGLTRCFDSIMRAEWHIKSGERTPEQALEILLADMALLFAPNVRT